MAEDARLRLGLDLDGTIYDWYGTVRFLLNQYRGRNLGDVEEWWDSYRPDEIEEGEWDWLNSEGIRRGLFRHGHLYWGAASALDDLARFIDIVVVTHRPREAVHDTLDWLSFHRIPATEVHILSQGQPKSSVRCDAYLDDSPYVIADLEANRPGTLIMLWSHLWNRAIPQRQHIRVASWKEVIYLLERRRLLLEE